MTQPTIEMTESGTGALLDAVYRQLGYADVEGTSLLEARPTPRGVPGDGWIEKGDWLLSAYKANVTKVFFLENNPVALFLRTEDPDPEVHRRLYNRAWSMARPRLLFFARPGAIAIYDLAEKPPKTGRDFEKLEPLRIAHAAADVATRMKDFRRQALESGKVFETERRFADLKNRADKTLISDLKKVRSSLVESGLGGEKLPYAHSLIGRSIFIRYLEDRNILTERTFRQVAASNRRWQKLLQAPPARPGLDATERPSLYARALDDKELTYALFHKLAEDFNGDMFPDLAGEEGVVSQDHLQAVFNFSHTRRTFFEGAVSPFVAVVFNKLNSQLPRNSTVKYWCAAKTRLVDGIQAVVFSHADVKHLRPEDDLTHHQTWKTFWWGTHLDHNLALGLQARHGKLGSLTAPGMYGRGYQFGNREKDAKWLSDYKSLPIRHFHRYGHLDPTKFEDVPPRVERRGVREVYHGRRFLVRRGIDEGEEPKGQVVARLEEDEFCFTNAIHGVKLSVPGEWRYKVILGIFWSSLARYFFFVTGSSWGIWHHELHLEEEVLAFPVCLPEEGALRRRIVRIVEKLQSYDPPVRSVLNPDGVPQDVILKKRRELERSLDDAIFELYGLNEAEIDLIRDMCDVTIDFYYWGSESQAVKPVRQKLSGPRYGSMVESAADGIQDYLRIFVNVWSRYLDDGTHLHWTLHASPHGPGMLAVVFSVHEAGDEPSPPEGEDAWGDVLRRLDDALLHPVSSRIYVDGMVRAVTGEEIVVIKRNEKRLWTRSMAREDAEATLVQAMKRDPGGED